MNSWVVRIAALVGSMFTNLLTRGQVKASIHLPIESKKKKMKTPEIPKLLDVIIEAWTKCLRPPYGDGMFTPEDGVTDCNRFVDHVAKKFGYDGLTGLRANQIYDHLMANPNDWTKVSSFSAVEYVNRGYLIIAVWKNPDPNVSGHVAVVRPGKPVTSAKWGHPVPTVPMVANVGPAERCRMDRGANWAFKEEPSYFVFEGVTSN